MVNKHGQHETWLCVRSEEKNSAWLSLNQIMVEVREHIRFSPLGRQSAVDMTGDGITLYENEEKKKQGEANHRHNLHRSSPIKTTL